MRDLFDLPDLGAMDDGIANGTFEPQPGEAAAAGAVHRARGSTTRCTGCATTPAPRPSSSRTSCCSPTTSSTSTSSCASATRRWPTPDSDYIAFVEPGNVVDAPRRRCRREPGDDARRAAAAPAADAGLPPGARGPQRHHDGQHRRRPGQRQDHHRPHRGAAPARLDDARPLRRPAQHAAARRLRAGPRLRARGPRARRGTAAVGADPGAGRGPGRARAGGGRRHAAARATS